MEDRELLTVLHAVADAARLRILQRVAWNDGITVKALTRELRISQPLVSWHLRTLRRAGLVSTRRMGREVHCALNKARMLEAGEALTESFRRPGELES